jgi:hypothetical protein
MNMVYTESEGTDINEVLISVTFDESGNPEKATAEYFYGMEAGLAFEIPLGEGLKARARQGWAFLNAVLV